jgi:hypothetical protein
MRTDRIDFISAYCDTWCERCAFTMRCSHYAVKMALAMCDGDASEALELAVGRPAPVGPGDEEQEPPWRRDLPNEAPDAAEMAEFERLEQARTERLDESPLTTGATIVMMTTFGWLEANHDTLRRDASPELAEALEIVGWDCGLIGVKIHRALRGRDEARQGEWSDDDPVQNDWNGSAKVALISIQRSAAAWRVVAGATGDAEAELLAGRLATLQQDVEREFPDAWRFRRPGFDDPSPAL